MPPWASSVVSSATCTSTVGRHVAFALDVPTLSPSAPLTPRAVAVALPRAIPAISAMLPAVIDGPSTKACTKGRDSATLRGRATVPASPKEYASALASAFVRAASARTVRSRPAETRATSSANALVDPAALLEAVDPPRLANAPATASAIASLTTSDSASKVTSRPALTTEFRPRWAWTVGSATADVSEKAADKNAATAAPLAWVVAVLFAAACRTRSLVTVT